MPIIAGIELGDALLWGTAGYFGYQAVTGAGTGIQQGITQTTSALTTLMFIGGAVFVAYLLFNKG